MSPNFLPDSFVFCLLHSRQYYSVGDVVLVGHPYYGKMIKRIAAIEIDTKTSIPITINGKVKGDISSAVEKFRLDQINHLSIVGDNLQSVSSEQMGKIFPKQIIGKVFYQVKP